MSLKKVLWNKHIYVLLFQFLKSKFCLRFRHSIFPFTYAPIFIFNAQCTNQQLMKIYALLVALYIPGDVSSSCSGEMNTKHTRLGESENSIPPAVEETANPINPTRSSPRDRGVRAKLRESGSLHSFSPSLAVKTAVISLKSLQLITIYIFSFDRI